MSDHNVIPTGAISQKSDLSDEETVSLLLTDVASEQPTERIMMNRSQSGKENRHMLAAMADMNPYSDSQVVAGVECRDSLM